MFVARRGESFSRRLEGNRVRIRCDLRSEIAGGDLQCGVDLR